MPSDDDFEPRLGRLRTQGGRQTRSYLSRILAATNLARGGGPFGVTSPRFSGSRIGRGAGVGRMLASRDRHAAFRQRRVLVKTSIVRLAGKGAGAAAAHLRYLQRDGTTRDGTPGTLYGPDTDVADAAAFRERGAGDRHQFRFIVSAEDGAEYDDLKPLTRRLMMRMEEDLGTKLDWVAVDHFNTGHPHMHVVLRGKDERGQDLVIARDYLTHGLRERAAELVDLDLGPRSTRAIEHGLRRDIDQERVTSTDRALIRDMDTSRLVDARGRDAFDQTVRAGRLTKLARLGLAEPVGADRWRLAPDLVATLRRMGERDDILRTMQRTFSEAALERPAIAHRIYEPGTPDDRGLTGRVIARGLADEHADRHFLIVDATDGCSHYVDIGRGVAVDLMPTGAVIRIEPLRASVHEVDRTVAAIAAANGGHYDVEAHLRFDPTATEAFAETHVRRLEAIRRKTGGVEREPSGEWVIAPDHLTRVQVYEDARVRDQPVAVALLSAEPVERLAGRDAATWLDRELVSPSPEPVRDAGFGRDVLEAQARRRQWLLAQGFAEDGNGSPVYSAGMLRALQRREVLQVAAQMSEDLKLPFVEARPGAPIEGVYRRSIDLTSGRFALVERSREFTLVPWRPVLERQVGKSVSGILRGDGISWTIGRTRGPSIS